MVYTRSTVWPLVFGIIMVAYAYLVQSGAMEPVIKFLGTARIVGEMQMLGYCFGAIGILAGLWQLLAPPKEGQGDYYLSMAGGVAFATYSASFGTPNCKNSQPAKTVASNATKTHPK